MNNLIGGSYETLIEEVKGLITEGVFTSRWALIEAYHNKITKKNWKDKISKLILAWEEFKK